MTSAPSIKDNATLAANRAALHQRIASAAQSAGRDSASIELIAVTKSVNPEMGKALFDLGESSLAENRLESFDAKLASFGDARPTWHYIGHVQRNKARKIVERSDVIHSVDSLKLLEHLARIAGELGRKPGIYLQVKIADEQAKFGFAQQAVEAAIEAALGHQDCLELRGLMVMAPLCPGSSEAERKSAARATFAEARELASTWPQHNLGLSMGMTGDFEQAIAEGSTAIRVGSAFFQGLDSSPKHV